jgi:hypothetical protein
MATHHCPSHPCPICYPGWQPWPPYYGYGTVALPQGCICPAGAEKTCQGPLCPRRPMITGSGFSPITASADTHPKDGDAVAAPLVSGAVAATRGETPDPSHATPSPEAGE